MTTAAPSQTPPTKKHPPAVPKRPPTISRAATARRLGVAERTIDRYVAAGHLIAHRDRISRTVGIEIAGIEQIERERVLNDAG